MSPTASPNAATQRWIDGVSLAAAGLLWLVVAGMVAVVIRLQVPTPAELLVDVADRRALWIAASAVLIVQPVALLSGAGRLAGRAGPAAPLARSVLGLAAGALLASGVVHGVFGAHLASKVTAGPLGDGVVLDAELTHAVADTFWFVGVGALMAATALVTLVTWRPDRVLALVGAGAVACNLLQFGWFVDHAFGVFAGPGTALQALWFGLLGRSVVNGAD